jgi:hypothetical protein
MFVGTHAFLPVLAASAVNAYRVRSGRRSLFTAKELVLIGVAGSLPDLLSPHISLSARLSSWTHNLWFLLGSCPILLTFAWLLSREKRLLLGTFLWAAVALHLIVDMSSGGISPLYPFGSVIGFRTVPFRYWAHLDVFLISAFLFLAFWVRRVKGTDQLE